MEWGLLYDNTTTPIPFFLVLNSSCQDSWSEGIKLHLQCEKNSKDSSFDPMTSTPRLNQFISMVAIVTANRAQTGYFISSSLCVATHNLRMS